MRRLKRKVDDVRRLLEQVEREGTYRDAGYESFDRFADDVTRWNASVDGGSDVPSAASGPPETGGALFGWSSSPEPAPTPSLADRVEEIPTSLLPESRAPVPTPRVRTDVDEVPAGLEPRAAKGDFGRLVVVAIVASLASFAGANVDRFFPRHGAEEAGHSRATTEPASTSAPERAHGPAAHDAVPSATAESTSSTEAAPVVVRHGDADVAGATTNPRQKAVEVMLTLPGKAHEAESHPTTASKAPPNGPTRSQHHGAGPH
ncbi:MAG: hypothetical protein U0169_09785 [Polyangiaceae bacterium]